jgi:hypothetical protein
LGIRAIIHLLALFAAVRSGTALAQNDPNLAAKLSALDKLCASGVLAPDECARRHAALTGAQTPASANAGPGHTFRDPQGRYSAPLPDQWNASSDNGVARLSSGANWVMLIPGTDGAPDQAASSVIGDIRRQYKSLNQAQSGRPKINGHDAVFATFNGVNGNGQEVAVTVAGIQAPGGHVLVYVSSAPLAGINSVSPQFNSILQGIRFAGE